MGTGCLFQFTYCENISKGFIVHTTTVSWQACYLNTVDARIRKVSSGGGVQVQSFDNVFPVFFQSSTFFHNREGVRASICLRKPISSIQSGPPSAYHETPFKWHFVLGPMLF